MTKALILAHCPPMTGRLRLVEDHGFEATSANIEYVQKVMEGSFTDICAYGQTLRGIRGLVSVEANHTIPQDTEASK